MGGRGAPPLALALLLFSAALRVVSRDPHHTADQLEQERSTLYTALSQNPSAGELWGEFGATLFEMERYGEAKMALSRARELLPTDIEILYNEGQVLLHTYRRRAAAAAAAAAATAAAAAAAAPTDAFALGALAAFDRVLAIDPAHFHALVNRAQSLQYVGRRVEAYAAFQSAAVSPARPRRLLQSGAGNGISLSLALSQAALLDHAAEGSGTRSSSKGSDDNRLMDRPADAARHYQEAIALDPGNTPVQTAGVWAKLGGVQARLGDTSAALRSMDAALTLIQMTKHQGEGGGLQRAADDTSDDDEGDDGDGGSRGMDSSCSGGIGVDLSPPSSSTASAASAAFTLLEADIHFNRGMALSHLNRASEAIDAYRDAARERTNTHSARTQPCGPATGSAAAEEGGTASRATERRTRALSSMGMMQTLTGDVLESARAYEASIHASLDVGAGMEEHDATCTGRSGAGVGGAA